MMAMITNSAMASANPLSSSFDFSTLYDNVSDVNTTANATTEDGVRPNMFPTPRFFGRFLQTGTMTFIFVAALCGNILVILLCLKKPKELKVSRRLILHLAILNLSMSVLLMPSVIVSAAAQGWVMSQGWCAATGFFKGLFCLCIILNLVLISMDRYFSVVKPLHYYTSMTVKYHGALLVVIWVISIVLSMLPLIAWDGIQYHPSRYMCTADWSRTDAGYIIFVFIGGFLIPFFVMLYVYITIYRAARMLMKRKQGRRLSADMSDSASGSGAGSVRVNSSSRQEYTSEQSTDSRKSRASRIFRRRSSKRSNKINVSDEWKIAKTGVIVMASFVICWLPYYIVLMVDAAYGFGTTVPLPMAYAWWECFAMWMALSSCAINPYVYVLRSPPMREQASKAAHNAFARCRQCCEEDSRKIRRRGSGKTGRYSFFKLSSRFSTHTTRTNGGASKTENKLNTPNLDPNDPETHKMVPQQTQSLDHVPTERTHSLDPVPTERDDQEENVDPTAAIELLSYNQLDV